MSKTMSRSTGLNAALAIGLSATATLFASPVAAQILVTDGASITANNAGFAAQLAKTVEQYAQQIQSYATQVQQYQQMLTKVMNLGTNFSITPSAPSQLDANQLIQANCGGGGSITSSVLNGMSSLMGQSLTQSQQQICAAIITAQVDKYNQTVLMMQQIQSNIPAVQKIGDLASTFSNMGSSSSATTQISGFSAQLNTEMSNWQAQMNADDALINSLQQAQGILAKKALNGGGTLLGNTVQATAFAAAFK
ncbi:hypothetical protein [Rhodanobacter aciditrophus]|uniref:hypothetical protein n=1 Tax=Rhodanobacter aciditrophus TaxID=1623218 RepID=UPI003CFB6A04